MDESILTSIKKLLGITEEYTQFDTDIIIHINSVFTILQQIGVGPVEGFSISDKTSKWSDFLDDEKLLVSVISYMYFRVRLMFDPPNSSIVSDAIKNSDLLWSI